MWHFLQEGSNRIIEGFGLGDHLKDHLKDHLIPTLPAIVRDNLLQIVILTLLDSLEDDHFSHCF